MCSIVEKIEHWRFKKIRKYYLLISEVKREVMMKTFPIRNKHRAV